MPPLRFDRETPFERVTRRIGLYVLSPLLLLAALPAAVHIAQQPYFGFKVRQLVVVAVDPASPADRAGVSPGERIAALDGEPTVTMFDWYRGLAGDYGLHARRLRLERDGTTRTVAIAPTRPPNSHMIWGYSLWLAGLTFLLMGTWVLSKRHDPVARNFYAMAMIFAFFLIDVPALDSTAYLTGLEITRDVLELLLPVFFLRFFLLFPSIGPQTRENRRLLRWILLPPVPLLAATAVVHLLGPRQTPPWLLLGVQTGALVLFLAYFVVGLGVFARKVLRRERRIQYTKMRVVLLGLLAGLGPFLTALLFGSFAPGTSLSHWELLGFSLLLVPVSFGLAIMRYGALDTAFVVRTSLIYILLTALVLLGYLFVVGIVGHLMTRAFQVSTYPLVIIIVAASGLVVLPLRRTAQHWVDRAFYPARLANRSAIVQLGDELTGIIDRDAAVELLLDRLMHLYRPRTLALYLSEGDASVLVPVATRLMDGAERVPERLAAGSGLARYLDRIRRPVFAEELEDLLAVDSAPGISLELLAQLESELLVPLVTGNRLTGFISLGAKTGGRLYGQEDLANLRTLALQLASLLESRRLYEESLAREQLETELKVAREIQSQLLPDAPLTQPGVAMCGRTEPCRAVGGDYFDYFELGEDRVGFCIADVAGKGIPAALLMSSLRVSFRGAAVDGTAPEDVLGRLNRVAAELLAPGQFVCFFYGVLSTRDGLLRYCNAGIDPPLLLRRDGVIERLKKGGPVLGILAEHNYRRGTLALKPDDLLLLYTDGITEQRNAEGEFYDVERLLAVLGAHIRPPVSDGPLEKLLETIFTSVDVFGGNDRSDDRTVILLRRSTL